MDDNDVKKEISAKNEIDQLEEYQTPELKIHGKLKHTSAEVTTVTYYY